MVGLNNISTLEACRRRGFGAALTLQPLLDARSQGYRTAILQLESQPRARANHLLGRNSIRRLGKCSYEIVPPPETMNVRNPFARRYSRSSSCG